MIEIATIVSRLLTLASMAILGGGLLFLCLAWPNGYRSERLRTLLRRSLMVALAATGVAMLLHGPNVTGRGIRGIADPALLSATAGTEFGRTLIARLIVLMVIALLLRQGLRRPLTSLRFNLAVAALVPTLVATMSVSGHARENGSFVLAIDMLHFVAASVWLGGLVILVFVLLPTQRKEELAIAIPAFSVLAFSSVVVLAITGGIHALIRVGSIGSLVEHGYGQLVLLKIAMFGVLLVFGGLSHRWTQRRFVAKAGNNRVSDEDFRRGIRQTAGAEIAIGFVVLSVTAVLAVTNPPLSETEQPSNHVSAAQWWTAHGR